jgi:large subunit ribosomal protein L35
LGEARCQACRSSEDLLPAQDSWISGKIGSVAMPKQKTHKGIRKRFKLTATGKVKHRKASRGHKLAKKGGKRNRQARADRMVEGKQIAMIRYALQPSP